MQETKTLHPQPPLYRELVPQLLSHAVLLIAIKWVIVGIMGQLRKVDGITVQQTSHIQLPQNSHHKYHIKRFLRYHSQQLTFLSLPCCIYYETENTSFRKTRWTSKTPYSTQM